jgi:SAM-dependent methyltransferase
MLYRLRRLQRSFRLAGRLAPFIGAAEYSEISGIFPLHFPTLDIELDATPDQLFRMLAKIERSWTEMGAVRPHHSVMTEEQYRPRNLDKSLDDFWRSGVAELETIDFHLEQLGCRELHDKTCVEYGCGLGRVTIPLATRFAVVHAYDISPTHLAGARERAAVAGRVNIQFHERGGGLLSPLEPCDFFYSRLVFQHNPPPVIRELIRLALNALHPGGLAIFGVPVYLADYRFRIEEYLRQPPTPFIEMHCLPQREIFSLIAGAGCSLLEVREERNVTPTTECLANLFVVTRPTEP